METTCWTVLDHLFAWKSKHSHRNFGAALQLYHMIPKFSQHSNDPLCLIVLHGREDDGIVAWPSGSTTYVCRLADAEQLGRLRESFDVEALEHPPKILIE